MGGRFGGQYQVEVLSTMQQLYDKYPFLKDVGCATVSLPEAINLCAEDIGKKPSEAEFVKWLHTPSNWSEFEAYCRQINTINKDGTAVNPMRETALADWKELFNTAMQPLVGQSPSGAQTEVQQAVQVHDASLPWAYMPGRNPQTPWENKPRKWGMASVTHKILSSEITTYGAYIYDIGTNILGFWAIVQWAGDATDIVKAITIVIGAILLSFTEIIGARALANFKKNRNSRSDDPIVSTTSGLIARFSLVTGVLSIVLWACDLVLSVVPWILLFGVTNPVGWAIGITLSILVEYLELESHERQLVNHLLPKTS